jgi:hypothetical protein
VHYRRPKLKAPKNESIENPPPSTPAAPAEPVDAALQEKLELLNKLGISMADLEKLFKSK